MRQEREEEEKNLDICTFWNWQAVNLSGPTETVFTERQQR